MTTINQIVDCLKYVHTLNPCIWIDDHINENDMNILKKEAYDNSTFDTLKLKQTVFETHTKKIVKKTDLARITILGFDDQIFPWNMWGRIFQAMGKPTDSEFWQVYIYASKQKRLLPETVLSVIPKLGPEHVNGGYTYACSSKAVIIYRYEEVTRVLIHELLHASCTDNMSLSVEVREAATETWAELFLIAILSKGSVQLAKKLWSIQEKYILDLHYTLKKYYNIHQATDYVARYTIMRTPIFQQFGISFNNQYTPKKVSTSRFTSPYLDKYIL